MEKKLFWRGVRSPYDVITARFNSSEANFPSVRDNKLRSSPVDRWMGSAINRPGVLVPHEFHSATLAADVYDESYMDFSSVHRVDFLGFESCLSLLTIRIRPESFPSQRGIDKNSFLLLLLIQRMIYAIRKSRSKLYSLRRFSRSIHREIYIFLGTKSSFRES